MSTELQIKVFLVDDDALYLKSLEIDFSSTPNFSIKTFATGESCLAALNEKPDVIFLDYHLDGIQKNVLNGIETLEKIKALNAAIPVIMLSAQDKIDVAINCMHRGAYDYVIKSETAFLHLQKNINSIFKYRKIEKQLNWYMERL